MNPVFHAHVYSRANETIFHMTQSFAQGLVLKKRQTTTRKWPITLAVSFRLTN